MNKIYFHLFLLFFLLKFSGATAQLSKANKLYANFEYADAIPCYLKVVKKGNNVLALQNLANCYRLTKNYAQAEVFYARAIEQSAVDPINYFYYAQVLKNDKKYEEAEKQFNRFMELVPADRKAEISVKSIQELKHVLAQPARFEISNVEAINTKHSEFAPVLYKNGIVFTSDRDPDLVNFEKSGWNKQPYFNLYFSERNSKDDKDKIPYLPAKPFSQKVNSIYHDGFATFTADQSQMLFSRIDLHAASGKIIQPHIYSSKASGTKWENPILLKLANDSVWVSHPSISADGLTLFFASDMPGGFGGKDIYFCKKTGDNWGPPENLGESINTVFDEAFPCIRKDNVLFFSSTGHSGLGGLDIFASVNVDGHWKSPDNLGAPLNSSTDDFNIVFADDNISGFFSSDRIEGKGADDIYSFVQMKLVTMKGKILLSKNINQPAKGMKLLILSEDGRVIGVTSTDEFGFFKFENLNGDYKYMVKMDETDSQFKPSKKYYLANENDKIVSVTVINESGEKFIFEKLPADLNSMENLSSDDALRIAGTLLVGDNPAKPYANKKIALLNEKGEVVKVLITNAFGAFVFSELDPDKNYFISAEEEDLKLLSKQKITLTNTLKKEVASMKADAKGGFRFKLLQGDKNELSMLNVDDEKLRMDLKGKLYGDTLSNPLGNMKLILVNENGEIKQAIETDADGGFLFTSLPFNQSFLISLEESDPRFKSIKKVIFTDDKGRIVKISRLKKEGGFRFQFLPGDYKSLTEAYVDDPWLKVLQFKQNAAGKADSITIVESIYYKVNDFALLPEAEMILDKVIDIMRSNEKINVEVGSHTDSRSSDEYNLKLSQKRAKSAADYIIRGGIPAKRVSGKGFGETRLINKCGNGVTCSDEEHAKNRRTEFRIFLK